MANHREDRPPQRPLRIEAIGIDADDTLWHNEPLYQETQQRLVDGLARFASSDEVKAHLLSTERGNLALYGYGIKSFILSMIETALDFGGDEIDHQTIQEILRLGRTMIAADVVLLPHVRETVSLLAHTYPLWLITKGDLLDQRRKLDRSGLAPYFVEVDVVTEKTAEVYAKLLNERGVDPQCFVMVGNSPRSDIQPVVSLGGTAILVPYHVMWEHEASSDEPPPHHVIDHFGELPGLLAALSPSRRSLFQRIGRSRRTL